jgi:hypothetical protein
MDFVQQEKTLDTGPRAHSEEYNWQGKEGSGFSESIEIKSSPNGRCRISA